MKFVSSLLYPALGMEFLILTCATSPSQQTPAVGAATPSAESAVQLDAVIPANTPDGFLISNVSKGTRISLKYQSGKWKSWGHLATGNPDDEKTEGRDTCRLAIALPSKDGLKGDVVALVAPATKDHPFIFEAQKDYAALVLRINAGDGSFSHYPGKVEYDVEILPRSVGQTITAATASLSAPSPLASVSAPPARQIVLAHDWDGDFEGGDLTLKDLATLFQGSGTPSESQTGDPSIMVFENVPFLTPISAAKDLLGLTGELPSKTLVACPGLPRDSFSYYAFDGIFEGHFNRLCLVTDESDQVVSAQLVDEAPRGGKSSVPARIYHTYNFVNYRAKALDSLRISHKVSKSGPGLLVVDSVLIDPESHRVLEESRWYVPQAIVNLILRCVSKR